MLTIHDIHAGYGRTEVLHGISVNVEKGMLAALIGANGAGKTTTMRIASGMLAPKSGRVTLDGRDITGLASHVIARCGLAHVPEGRRVFPTLSVEDNLRIGAITRSTWGACNGDVEEDLENVLFRFPRLKERSSQLAGTLSGGEQQMLAIGRALMLRPKVLLLDEPSMGLAPRLVEDVFETIMDLKETGVTMLLVEQFAAAALKVADDAYVMEAGRIAISGTAEQLRNDPAIREAYLGKSHEEHVQ